jgi:hypothetical protein
MNVHESVGEGVTLSVRVVVREWRVVHLGVTVLRHKLDSIRENTHSYIDTHIHLYDMINVSNIQMFTYSHMHY